MAMSDLLLDDSFDLLVSESDLDGLPETVSANFDLGFDLKNTDELPEPKCQTKVNKPEAQKRFVNLEDTDLDDLAKANSEKATLYQTRWALKLFKGILKHFSILTLSRQLNIYSFYQCFHFTCHHNVKSNLSFNVDA